LTLLRGANDPEYSIVRYAIVSGESELIPMRIIHGDSLAMKYWSVWSNIHYIAPWLPLALRPQAPEAAEQGQAPKPAEVESIKVSLGQQELVS
jgi:hypothetical protein